MSGGCGATGPRSGELSTRGPGTVGLTTAGCRAPTASMPGRRIASLSSRVVSGACHAMALVVHGCGCLTNPTNRGAHGRFESRDGGTPTSGRSPAPPLPPRRQRRHSITGTDGDEWRRLLQNSVSASRTTTGPVTYLGESWHFSWVLLGEPDATESRPLHLPTLVMEDEESVSNRVNKELWDKGAYVLPRPETRDLLIVEYFERCHPVYPIVQKNVFMNSLRANAFSHLLLQSVLVVAATHCDLGILQRAGYVTRQEAVGAFYNRARVLFDGDVEPDKITNIQSIFLLQFWWRSVTDHKDTLWWLAGAIRLAQTMGLHRSTSRSRLGPEDRRLWRRIWWLLFVSCAFRVTG